VLFNSLHFLLFLPLVIGLYYIIPQKSRWVLILLASCYFYMAFIPGYILILFFIILLDYSLARVIETAPTKARKRLYLVFSLAANIALLAFFKYFTFINENVVSILKPAGINFKMYHLNVVLPIGLSFHTFQSMSYIIEVYRGNQKAEKHLGYFANYVLFFPQMVAGPIEKYKNLGNELKKNVVPVYENFARGFRLMLFGLFVKMAVADNIAPFVNSVYDNPTAYHSADVWLAVLLFSFQIYADFYGYSTIAMGTAQLMGIKLSENFRTPYLALSINDFWKRWHITLTSWFREYLYIPLGGNKSSAKGWIVNILIVFFISGLWHGASWTFVAWGILHGIVYLLERGFNKLFNFSLRPGVSILNILLGVKTFLIVSFIWIFFRAETFARAELVITSLFNNWNNSPAGTYLVPVCFAILLVISDILFYKQRVDDWLDNRPAVLRWSVYTVFLFCIMCLGGVVSLPFIYFQF
jgi:alginate O-acetyltransferase complex protein AlgI